MTAYKLITPDFNQLRATFAREIVKVTGLSQNQVILEETEQINAPRPAKPYFGFKITTPGSRYGDDAKINVKDNMGNPTQIWNSGGPRKMSVDFNCYGNSHEEAYNLMCLWQSALDLEDIQSDLRIAGIAVWIIGTVADLSALLNTGYEGRAHLDCQFGLAFNIQSNLGEIDSGSVEGTVNFDGGTAEVNAEY
jgi:hypothetical protein